MIRATESTGRHGQGCRVGLQRLHGPPPALIGLWLATRVVRTMLFPLVTKVNRSEESDFQFPWKPMFVKT